MLEMSSQPKAGHNENQSPSARVALVVGNGAYVGQRLANPVNDAQLLERVLRRLDFDVELLIDAGKAKLEQAIVRFGERIERAGPAAAALFYFAGHGVQYMGSNYLLPIDAEIPATRYLKSGAVRVDAVVEELARKDCDANIIILDACRNNSIPEAYGASRDITQGLAGLHQVPDRTLVAFSTAAGAVATDGEGRNSPYAMVLASQLASPGLSILDIFGRVAGEVVLLTNRKQSPAIFMQGEPPRIVLQPIKVEVPKMEKPATTSESLADRQQISIAVGTGGVRDRTITAGAGVYQMFEGFEHGPDMVAVPSGAFVMGADNLETAERLRHSVVIAEPFAVGRYAVTVAEYAHFVDATGHKTADAIFSMESQFPYMGDLTSSKKPGRSWRRPGFSQAADHPVVGVSWYDAKAYATWLASETGKPYRLLTEAEWEYVARAGSTARYAWGEVITRDKANYDDLPELRRKSPLAWKMKAPRGTCPVDLHEPNAWGLFNMHGNVAEWVEDGWHDSYDGAPADGSAWSSESGDGSTFRVVRGGDWQSTSYAVCSYSRASLPPGWATSWVGFRVARTLVR